MDGLTANCIIVGYSKMPKTMDAIKLSQNRVWSTHWRGLGMSVLWVTGTTVEGSRWELAVDAWGLDEQAIKDRLTEQVDYEFRGTDLVFLRRSRTGSRPAYIVRFTAWGYIDGQA